MIGRGLRRAMVLAVGLTGAACNANLAMPGMPVDGSGGSNVAPGTGGSNTPAPPAQVDGFKLSSLTAIQADAYLRKMAPSVVGRVLSSAERAQIQSQRGDAIAPIVAAWVKEPAFVDSARRFLETSLAVSGKTEGINFDLPGNLATYLVKNRLPWSQVITSDKCYDDALAPVPCDTGAPYTAGALTTRAFMISRVSRYNLQRASALLRNFACRQYPMEPELQPRAEKTWLISMFQAQTPEELKNDPLAKNGFGQGFACYTCHGQFSIHAQLFMKFAEDGLWHAEANGAQSPKEELGRSDNNLMASHFANLEQSKLEGINIFGKPVQNLAEAARVMASSPTFVECAANRYLDVALGVQSGTIEYNNDLFVELGKRIRAQSPDPSFDVIINALLTDTHVVRSIVKSLTGDAP
jgi:hypothetical protein